MGVVGLVARAELRRRWLGALVLSLVVGIAGGAVLTAVAGARRTSTAFDRFVSESRPADALVNVPDASLVDEIERFPEVEALAQLSTVAAVPDVDGYFAVGASVDGRYGITVDRARLVVGRRADADAVDEVTLPESTARELGLAVGSRLRLLTFTPEQVALLQREEADVEPAGPEVMVTIVGIERHPTDLSAPGEGAMVLTPAFHRAYADRIGEFEGKFLAVRLAGGRADLPGFVERTKRLAGPGTDVRFDPVGFESAGIDDSLGVLTIGLVIFAVVAGLAGLVAVGQALGRQAFAAAADHLALRSVGASRRQRFLALLVPAIPIAVAGAAAAVGIALVASPLMPIGIARRAEPDPGLAVDGLVLGLGFASVVVLVVALAALSAARVHRLADRPAVGGEPGSRAAPSAIVERLRRGGFSPPAVAGVRMALEPGRGRNAVPARPALVGAAVGVAGLIAALVFAASLDRLVTTPRLYGWNWDVAAGGPGLEDEYLLESPDVGALAEARFTNVEIARRPVEAVGVRALEGAVFLTVIDGRPPRGLDEVALGAETLAALGRGIGDTVTAAGRDGEQRVRIVGRVVFPRLDDRAVLADGAAFTEEGLGQLVVDDEGGDGGFTQALVRFAPGVDDDGARRRLQEAAGEPPQGPQLPTEVARLTQVDRLPQVLAAFLALLATLAVGHALVTSVRRRRQDLAILKTLGFVRRQVSATVAWQATTLVIVGLVAGIPTGIVAGGWAWALVADRLGIATGAAVPLLAVLLAIPTAIFVANLIGFLPGRIAGRTKPAAVLRTE